MQDFIVLLEELAWEAELRYLEHDSKLFDVDCMEGVESSFVWGQRKLIGLIQIFVPEQSLIGLGIGVPQIVHPFLIS